jgi:hypothetical protein
MFSEDKQLLGFPNIKHHSTTTGSRLVGVELRVQGLTYRRPYTCIRKERAWHLAVLVTVHRSLMRLARMRIANVEISCEKLPFRIIWFR